MRRIGGYLEETQAANLAFSQEETITREIYSKFIEGVSWI